MEAKQRLHNSLVQAVVNCLQTIFNEGYYADKVIERTFKANKRWGARDRKFVAESVYEMVRWWRYLWFVSGEQESLETDALLNLFGVWWYLEKKETSDYLSIPVSTIKTNQYTNPPRAIKESIPDWLDELAFSQLGDAWNNILSALNTRAGLFLRVNSLKTNKKDLINALGEEGVFAEEVNGVPDALHIPSRKNVFRTKAFLNGNFEVQDAASQAVAYSVPIESGMRLIDACAGAGGKSLHFAARMKNKGKIISLDVHPKKLEQLKIRARRAGASIIECRHIDSTKVVKRLQESADCLLLDVPCSGLGVLRRNPDTKWKLSREAYIENLQTQKQILFSYSSMLREGGYLIYSTCSILPEENEGQIEGFLKEHPNYEWISKRTFLPNIEGFDGFFIAVLKKQTRSS